MTSSPLDTPIPIEKWAIERLIPYEKNAKVHPQEQIDRLATHIKRFGWDQPIVVDADGVIIKGHGRRLAALKLGMTDVWVLVRRDLTKSEADAVRIADNAVVSNQYDTRMIQEELARLMLEDDISFTDEELGLADKDRDLLLKRLDVSVEDVIMTDTTSEIERQKEEDAERVEKADDEQVSLGEVFGFKKLPRFYARQVQRLIADAEEDTGLEGREAFLRWLETRVRA